MRRLRQLWALVFWAVVVTLSVTAQVSSKPAWEFQDLCWSPDGKRLTFTGIKEGKYRIYLIDAKAGSTPTPLFDVEGNQLYSSWSPDGKRIAFAVSQQGKHGIYVANADGTDVRKVSEDGGTPAWSPNGRTIAYNVKLEGKYQIYLMDTTGQSKHPVTHNSSDNFNPAWSPDGKYILFESDRDHDDKDEIYRIKPNRTAETLLRSGDSNLVFPNYSPDGNKILYGAVKNRNVDLHVMDSDGKNDRLLRPRTGFTRWSRRAGLLAFIGYDESKVYEIYLSKPDGTDVVAVTNLNHATGGPGLSPGVSKR